MNFRRTVIDPEGPQFPEYLCNRGIGGEPQATEHLYTTVGDPVQRFGHDHFRATRFEPAKVEKPGVKGKQLNVCFYFNEALPCVKR